MIVSVTKAAKLADVSRTTIYEKIKTGELSRTSEGIDTAELLRVFGELKTGKQSTSEAPRADSNDMVSWLRKQIDTRDQKLEELEGELTDTQQRLTEHRDAARALMSPDEFDTKLKQEAEKLVSEESARLNTEWEMALQERQQEIQAARIESAGLRTKRQEELKQSEELRKRLREIESRGLLARLFNRKPTAVG
jgi:DNA repair exonuclease SbcCD ATPase subunit